MTTRLRSVIFVAALLLGGGPLSFASTQNPVGPHLAQTGIVFEPNVGQIHSGGDYIARATGALLSLYGSGFSLSTRALTAKAGTRPTLEVHFLGSSAGAAVGPVHQLRGTVSDYRGSDPLNWRLNIPTYDRISYLGVYDGIDVAFHSEPGGFEYDFSIAPGVNPNAIHLAFEGADSLAVSEDGALTATVSGGAILHRKPHAYQLDAGGFRREIEVSYHLDAGNIVTFKVRPYDTSRRLIIDPLAYSTLFGQNNKAHHMVVDAAGNAYVAGEVTTGATPPNTDAVVTKFAPDGTKLWDNYYHGNGPRDGTDVAMGIALDSAGNNVFVTGSTTSDDFPTTANAFAITCGDAVNVVAGHPNASAGCQGHSDAFLIQLGTGGNTIYSTLYGAGYDDTGNAVAVDAAGLVYITGSTGGLPVIGKSQQVHTGGQCAFDAYLAKFDLSKSGAAQLLVSILIGGDGNDEGNALAIAQGQILVETPCMKLLCPFTQVGTIFIAGTTGMASTITQGGGSCFAGTNTVFPTTPNAFMAEGSAQSSHAFLVLMDSTGTRELYATIFPATEARGVAIVPTPPLPPGRHPRRFSQFSRAVITGVTEDISPVNSAFQTQFGGNTDAYVAQFDPTKTGSASLVYFTYLGGSGVDEGNDIAIYPNGTVAVVGSTTSTNFPIPQSIIPGNRPVQSALSPPACTGDVTCPDAFVATIGNQGKAEGFATFLGGGGQDWATGVALCNTGPCANSLYVSGTTFSANFPTTVNSFSGGPDEFVAKISFPPPIQIKPLHP